jgi:hypothetical protein
MGLYAGLRVGLPLGLWRGTHQAGRQVLFDKLLRIRNTALSRLMFICRSYVYLREEKAAHFHSMDRYAAHFTVFYGRLDQPVESMVTHCGRCKQTTLLPGIVRWTL